MSNFEKYATATHLYKPIVKRGVVDFAVGADWTPATGDVKISKDGAAAANVTNLPVAIVMGNTAMWDFSLTSGELTGAKIRITIADSATKAVEDQFFEIFTYGNASAHFVQDWSVLGASSAQATALQADTDDIQARLPAALVGGRMDGSVGAMAANVMTAAAAAADLTTELQTGLATAAQIPALVGGRMPSDLGSIAGSTTDVTKLAGLVKQRIGGGTLRAGSTATAINIAASDGATWWDDFGNVEVQITSGAASGLTFIVAIITGAGGATPVVTPKLPATLPVVPGTETYEVYALTQSEDQFGFATSGYTTPGTLGYAIATFLNSDIGAGFTAILAAVAGVATTATVIANRLGSWAGTGLNNVLGAFLALFNKSATVPSDVSAGYLPATDSLEAQTDVTLPATAEAVFTRNMGAKFANRTFAQQQLVQAAALQGKSSGLPTAPKYRDPGDTQNVIDAVTDQDGNRSSVTINVTGA